MIKFNRYFSIARAKPTHGLHRKALKMEKEDLEEIKAIVKSSVLLIN